MVLEKKKFVRYNEYAEKQDTPTIRLNHKERLWLEALKKYHNTDKDATALKKEAFSLFLVQEKYEQNLTKNRVLWY